MATCAKFGWGEGGLDAAPQKFKSPYCAIFYFEGLHWYTGKENITHKHSLFTTFINLAAQKSK